MSIVLPTPSGPHAVAFTDILTGVGKNETFFRIYYPTKKFESHQVIFPVWMEQEYFKELSVYFKGISSSFPLSVPINEPLYMPENIERLPLVLYSHGLLLSKDPYSFVCSDLASYGYLVAAVDHKDGSAAGSFYMEKTGEQFIKKSFEPQFVQFGTEEARIKRLEQVEIRVNDLIKVMDALEKLNEGKLSNIFNLKFDLMQFKNKVWLEKTAVMGHSHGGASTLVSMIKDDRFKLAVTQDPWMLAFDDNYLKEKIEKPIIFINCIGDIKKKDVLKMRQLDSDVTGAKAERQMVTLLGTSHFTQTDLGFFPETFLKSLNFSAENDPKLSNAINMKLTLWFLAKHFGFPVKEDIGVIMEQYKGYAILGTDIDVTDDEISQAKKRVLSEMEEKK